MPQENDTRFLYDQIVALFGKIDELTKISTQTQVELARMSVAISVRRECPHPGMCTDLKEELARFRKDTEARHESIEATAAELKTRSDELSGGYKAIMAMCVIGPLVTGAAVWLIVATNNADRVANHREPAAAVVTK